jgi:nucleotide-binding universal stress UspA family protein
MREVRELLVPLDGTAETLPALHVAAALGKHTGWPVSALVVCSPNADVWRERAWLAELAESCGVALNRVVVRPGDDVAAEILAEADDASSLLCLASHGRLGLTELVLGSTSSDLVRRTSGTLVLVGPECRPPEKLTRVLVGIDGSDPADRAVDVAGELADRFDLSVSVAEVVDAAAGSPHVSWTESLGRAVRLLDARKVSSEPVALRGSHPARELVRYAAAVDADLLVVGTHGRTGVQAVTMGSVANAVVRHAHRPVLVVHPVAVP